MQRSRSQVLYRYLPGSVYIHEDELIVQTWRVDGQRLGPSLNKTALLDEIERDMKQWPDEDRAGLPKPSKVSEEEFLALEPSRVDWDVWPLVFSCTNQSCGRVRRFFESRQVLQSRDENGRLRCEHCGSRVRQLRYFVAHACGRVRDIFVPECPSCSSRDDIYFVDTGSFETAEWRCRACGNRYVKGTRFTPCTCGKYVSENANQAFMRAFTVKDTRTYFPRIVTLLNLQSRTYDLLRDHYARGQIAVASYLGDEMDINVALDDVESDEANGSRRSKEEWEALESQLGNLPPDMVETLRRRHAPTESQDNVILDGVSPAVQQLAELRQLVERAVLYDKEQIPRQSLSDVQSSAEDAGRRATARALRSAQELAADLGIADISVTDRFPIAAAAYGYTRSSKQPGKCTLKGFGGRGTEYEGKTPVFTVTTDTEALLVTLSAKSVLKWLQSEGLYAADGLGTEREARLAILELFASKDDLESTIIIRTLVHSMSHAMLRALADGQSGFGESSLAEWLVPEALTFGIYVSSFQEYTLGALWTLLRNRTREWLSHARKSVRSCDNDPLCHNHSPRACERCLYLTYGCPIFNEGLSRRPLMGFWR
jgi:hypothetical protein